jgi:hypothetical protein
VANFKIIKNEDGSRHVTVVWDGNILEADSNHEKFDEIVDLLLDAEDDEDLAGLDTLFSPERYIAASFASLSSDVKIENGTVLYRGEVLDGALVNVILEVYNQGEDYAPFVKFLERVKNNPNPHSVEHLYRWISDRNFTIREDGTFIAYKGVREDLRSIRSGPAIHNGVPVNENILNSPGDVIEMDRDIVEFNPNVGCSVGLHVATYHYASTWTSQVKRVVKVIVDPADVVSVPTDCADEKMRACRYVVGEEVTSELDSIYEREPETEEDVVVGDVLPDFNKFVNTTPYVTWNGSNTNDTRLNHLNQKRDANGRFVKKGK